MIKLTRVIREYDRVMAQVGQYPQEEKMEGYISLSSQASNLPSPLEPVSVHRQKFAAKGLNDHDLVTLVGMLSFTTFNL